MSFREKLAWAAFATTLLCWGGYFTLVVLTARNGQPLGFALIGPFLMAVVAQIVLLAVTAAVAALAAPRDAAAPVDERDRTIGRRAGAIAYFAVLIGVIAVIAALHVGLRGVATIFALMGVIVLGEATRFGAQALGYRIGG